MNQKETWHSGENSCAVKEVQAANLSFPKNVLKELFESDQLVNYWRRFKNDHVDRKKELVPTK